MYRTFLIQRRNTNKYWGWIQFGSGVGFNYNTFPGLILALAFLSVKNQIGGNVYKTVEIIVKGTTYHTSLTNINILCTSYCTRASGGLHSKNYICLKGTDPKYNFHSIFNSNQNQLLFCHIFCHQCYRVGEKVNLFNLSQNYKY